MRDPADPDLTGPELPRGRRRNRLRAGLTSTLGTIMVELERQLLNRPRQEERYRRRDEATTTAADGSVLTIGLPSASETEPPA